MPASSLDEPSVERLLIEIDQMQSALASRTITAQATGLLAARFTMPTEQAWALLRETSNMSNRKLLDIARIVVDTHNHAPIAAADTSVALALAAVLDRSVERINAKGVRQLGGDSTGAIAS